MESADLSTNNEPSEFDQAVNEYFDRVERRGLDRIAEIRQEVLTEFPSVARELQQFFDSERPLLRGFGYRPGQLVGHFRLVQKINEGGMGEVWIATQLDPVRRKVALKFIKQGREQELEHRFTAEKQALALLEHPSIARFFDAGTMPDGRSFVAMEYVPGVPIDVYMNGKAVPLLQRLDIILQVCAAIQHAHQKGLIHRDLKPSNILVMEQDGVALAKVIDFGLVKAVHFSLTEVSLHTKFGVFAGTPAYMPPEQAAAWIKYIQKANAALHTLTPEKMAQLRQGEAYVWSSRATDDSFTRDAMKIQGRPRVTQHGGGTKTAVE